MVRLVLGSLLIISVGCVAPAKMAFTHSTKASSIQEFVVAEWYRYVVDTNLHSCYFTQRVAGGGAAMVAVDCQALKAAIPETAEAITWPAPGQ